MNKKKSDEVTSSHKATDKKTLRKWNAMSRRDFMKAAAGTAALAGMALAVPTALTVPEALTVPKALAAPKLEANSATGKGSNLKYKGKVMHGERKAAAWRAKAFGLQPAAAVLQPGGIPHYFGPYPNYANSPLPKGVINNITLISGGAGYTATPTVEITDLYNNDGVTQASVTATVDASGMIAGFTIVDGGSGYSAPVVTITDTTGTGAMATATIGPPFTGGLRKFVDSLPQLGIANNLGQKLLQAVPDQDTYPGCDYYEIALVEYREQMHSDLPLVDGLKTSPSATGGTKIRGYVQEENGVALTLPQYLGPIIVAERGTPVRIKFTNRLPTGLGGNLFIPVDTTVMGAGMGRYGMNPPVGDMDHTQNRATLHLHGGFVPWISDGTPHQWTTPDGETTSYPKGVSVQYVPDMWFVNGNVVPNTVGQTTPPVPGATNSPGDGSLTFYYNNQQSARLQFYHDHAYGITRLNVYVGEAAGYLVTDQVEKDLIGNTNVSGVKLIPNLPVLPGIGIPLVIQDRTFVDPDTIAYQDPTWNWGTSPGTPIAGDLWYPHVYMPNQNPWDAGGMNAFGRWHYGPWFWPPTVNIAHPPVANIYYQPDPNLPLYDPALEMPATPNPSMAAEAFMDTPIVNGTAYPYLVVDPIPYRFRILNAADDRFFNLQLYVTGLIAHVLNGGSGYSATPTVNFSGGGATTPATATAIVTNGIITDINITSPGEGYTSPPTVAITDDTGTGAIAIASLNTEVKMVPAADGREGGVPDPATAGPAFIMIGSEGGFLPEPVVLPNQPVTWNFDQTNFDFGVVKDHALLLGTAERADVIVDFTPFAGKTLILYNDAPAPFPAIDPRYDYYTLNPDQTDIGGTPPIQPGYGPNTRTIMQIKVNGTPGTPTPPNWVDPAVLTTLQDVWAKTATKRGVFEVSQDPTLIPEARYNSAYGKTGIGTDTFPADTYFRIFDNVTKTFKTLSGTPVTKPIQPKAIQDEMGEAFDNEYGRMSAMLGLELPFTRAGAANFMLYGYGSPPVDITMDSVTPGEPSALPNDGTQIWKITHNGVDTHTVHFHLFNVQLINRVAWDNAIRPPDPEELGWKETIRVNPLQDTIVALRPVLPIQPFDLPNSIRFIDVTMPPGDPLPGPPGGFKDPIGEPVTVVNHEVNFGHEYVYHCHLLAHEEMDMMHSVVFAVKPKPPSNLAATVKGGKATLTWTDNSLNETGFRIEKATNSGPWTTLATVPAANGKGTTVTYQDPNNLKNKTTYHYRVIAINVVGDTATYAAPSIGFPTMSLESAPSNTRDVIR